MQQNQPERRFSEGAQQQPVYRFPQNQPAQGWRPQQGFPSEVQIVQPPLSKKDQRALKRAHKPRRRIFTWWNLFAVIGIVTVIVQGMRYLVIPLLVYISVLLGGVL